RRDLGLAHQPRLQIGRAQRVLDQDAYRDGESVERERGLAVERAEPVEGEGAGARLERVAGAEGVALQRAGAGRRVGIGRHGVLLCWVGMALGAGEPNAGRTTRWRSASRPSALMAGGRWRIARDVKSTEIVARRAGRRTYGRLHVSLDQV